MDRTKNSRRTSSRDKGRLVLGLGLVAVGLLSSRWALERNFADDHRIESSLEATLILVFQACWVALGAWVILARRDIRPGLVRLGTAVMTGVLIGGVALDLRAWLVEREERATLTEWTAMVASEDVIQSLARNMPWLNRSAMNLRLPDPSSRSLFADEVRFLDIAPGARTVENPLAARLSITLRQRDLALEEALASADELRLWSSFLDGVDHFRRASFKVKFGHFKDGDPDRFEAHMGFSGLARMVAGGFASVHAEQDVVWRRTGEAEDATWVIESWRQQSFELAERRTLLFAEVLEEVLADRDAVARARASRVPVNWAEIAALGDEAFEHPRKLFDLFGGTSPGVTVVDLDRDGVDDLFVVDGEDSQLFRGRADGTFEDVSAGTGLVHDEATSATFADFDNDGDSDLFLGRNYERSLYFVNEGGRFVERSRELVQGELPFLVSASAAADYDGDGLLDLYVSTYGFSPLGYERRWPELREGPYLLGKYLPERDAAELDRRIKSPETNWVINAPGPPNVLLHNVGGGRFEAVADSGARVFSNTFHSTWSDYDGDGDPDIYAANDFSPNQLLRNEGGGRFVDVAVETGTTDVGFGMGVTFGDYDGDGRQDLYVSNMYSKAGKRILGQFGLVDERLKLMHRGNSLFRGTDGGFDKVSGTEEPAMLVENAGWSWGSQFVDFDSDGWLDLYALSGMITAPKELEIPVDI